jgi:hypothetical protein
MRIESIVVSNLAVEGQVHRAGRKQSSKQYRRDRAKLANVMTTGELDLQYAVKPVVSEVPNPEILALCRGAGSGSTQWTQSQTQSQQPAHQWKRGLLCGSIRPAQPGFFENVAPAARAFRRRFQDVIRHAWLGAGDAVENVSEWNLGRFCITSLARLNEPFRLTEDLGTDQDNHLLFRRRVEEIRSAYLPVPTDFSVAFLPLRIQGWTGATDRAIERTFRSTFPENRRRIAPTL